MSFNLTWAIENSLHWVMVWYSAMTSGACAPRTPPPTLPLTTHGRQSDPHGRRRAQLPSQIAAWDDDFLACLMSTCCATVPTGFPQNFFKFPFRPSESAQEPW